MPAIDRHSQHWKGRADAQSARALGQATGARLVLYGGLLAAGDSVRATAQRPRRQAPATTLAEIEQRDLAARIDRLSDSLTVAVLRDSDARAGSTSRARRRRPTTSLPALKAYLQGEQFYRAARGIPRRRTSSAPSRSIRTFALAYHRLAAVRRWRDREWTVPDSATYESDATHEPLLARAWPARAAARDDRFAVGRSVSSRGGAALKTPNYA